MIKTKIIKIKKSLFTQEQLLDCQDVLRQGGVLAIPTDTVYGLACDAFNQEAVRKIYELKGREFNKSLPVLINSADQLNLVASDIPNEAKKLIDRFWPGPLTLVFKTSPMALHITRGKSTLAVRIPSHGPILSLLQKTRTPMAATSANLSGGRAMVSAVQVIEEFMDKVDLIIDGGPCEGGTESSVVDASQFPFTLLRQGAVSKQDLYRHMFGEF